MTNPFQILYEKYIENGNAEELAQLIDFCIKTHIADRDATFLSFYKKQIECLRYRTALKSDLKKLTNFHGKLKRYSTDSSHFNLLFDDCLRNDLCVLHKQWKTEKQNKSSDDGIRKYVRGINLSVDDFYDEYSEQISAMILHKLPTLENSSSKTPALRLLTKKRTRILLSEKNKDNWKECLKKTAPKKPEMNSELFSLLNRPGPIIKNSDIEFTDAELLSKIGIDDLGVILFEMAASWDNPSYDLSYDLLKISILFSVAHWCSSNTKGDSQREKKSKTDGKSTTNLQKEYKALFPILKASSSFSKAQKNFEIN